MPSDSVHPDREPRVIRLSSEEAGDLLTACASATARRILLALQEDVVPASALADDLDTSLQNLHYHLHRLVDAGAIEIVGPPSSFDSRWRITTRRTYRGFVSVTDRTAFDALLISKDTSPTGNHLYEPDRNGNEATDDHLLPFLTGRRRVASTR